MQLACHRGSLEYPVSCPKWGLHEVPGPVLVWTSDPSWDDSGIHWHLSSQQQLHEWWWIIHVEKCVASNELWLIYFYSWKLNDSNYTTQCISLVPRPTQLMPRRKGKSKPLDQRKYWSLVIVKNLWIMNFITSLWAVWLKYLFSLLCYSNKCHSEISLAAPCFWS